MGGKVWQEVQNGVVRVWLSNPGRLNAMDAAMWLALAECFDQIAANSEANSQDNSQDNSEANSQAVRCVVLAGEGGQAFAAGGDIEEFLTVRATLDAAYDYHQHKVARALEAIRACPLPTLAAIQGPCIGGGLEIAASCDLRIAAESARFGAPILKLGFSMYPGEMAALLEVVGPAVLREILLEGRILDAHQACAKGLLSRVVADADFDAEIDAAVARIAAGAPLVARWHKAWIRRLQHDDPLTEDELRASFAFLHTEDYREGLAAFLEKRPPQFRGC